MEIKLADYIGKVPDFPKPGIVFYDISPLLADKDAWAKAVSSLADEVSKRSPDLLVGIEARGFLVAAAVSFKMGCGFAMVRKPNKLPGRTVKKKYALEYGSDTLEVKDGLIRRGQRIVILDDLLATGGTVSAARDLITQVGGVVEGAAFLVELDGLSGRDCLKGLHIASLMKLPA